MAAPYWVVQRHRLALLARWDVEGEKQRQADDELEAVKNK